MPEPVGSAARIQELTQVRIVLFELGQSRVVLIVLCHADPFRAKSRDDLFASEHERDAETTITRSKNAVNHFHPMVGRSAFNGNAASVGQVRGLSSPRRQRFFRNANALALVRSTEGRRPARGSDFALLTRQSATYPGQ
ncbi:hypothetical protein MKK88_32965 [Methylobacterium sp. E-005]|uniref:hypothetical protein n=1 Tax=Methylobacterium sp. E-005 TaxID=2836549 RepID=UPI001FBA32C3|nr:hypothetical protein [Methylobacterium sp. E-005]MCJ2090760.1 hypothetical protein [Methylobacterium sp. E-005]